MTARSRWPVRVVALSYLALLIVVPVGSVFYRAFAHGFVAAWVAITTPDALHALWAHFGGSLIAVPLNTVFGVGVALILARHRFRGAWLLDALIDIPLAVSPVVVGLAWSSPTVRRAGSAAPGRRRHHRHLRSAGDRHGVRGRVLPYVVRSVLPVLLEIGTDQEEAAATPGRARGPSSRGSPFPRSVGGSPTA